MSSVFIFPPHRSHILLVRLSNAELANRPFSPSSVHSVIHQLRRRFSSIPQCSAWVRYNPSWLEEPLHTPLSHVRRALVLIIETMLDRFHWVSTYHLYHPPKITTSTFTARRTFPNQPPLPPYLSIWRRFTLSANNPHSEILRQTDVIRCSFLAGWLILRWS